MPGDVVYGSAGGVAFIPAHLAEKTVVDAEVSHVRDIFGFQRLRERKYTAPEIDQNPWPQNIWADFKDWFYKTEETKEYRYLNIEAIIEEQKSGIVPTRVRHHGGLPWNP
jgi:hypothetical protein